MLDTPTDDTDEATAELARALGHPARIRILRHLRETPGCIGGDIVDQVGLAQSTVSEHLRILKAAGVIRGEISGPRVCYSINPARLTDLANLVAGLVPDEPQDCCTPPKKGTAP